MSSVCISNCINDATVSIRPVRTTYVSLYKWPESDAEFVRSVRRGGGAPEARVVDSISCRQMYLRSYTFSRDDDDKSKNKKKNKVTSAGKSTCLGRAKETVSFRRRKEKEEEEEEEGDVVIARDRDKTKRRRKRGRPKRKKRFACSSLFRLFQRLLSCAATVDVVDHV